MLKQILSSINCLPPLLIKVQVLKNRSGDSCSQILDSAEGSYGEQKLKS